MKIFRKKMDDFEKHKCAVCTAFFVRREVGSRLHQKTKLPFQVARHSTEENWVRRLFDDEDEVLSLDKVLLCKTCSSAGKKVKCASYTSRACEKPRNQGEVPPFSRLNNMDRGEIPEELSSLNWLEQILIKKCRALQVPFFDDNTFNQRRF